LEGPHDRDGKYRSPGFRRQPGDAGSTSIEVAVGRARSFRVNSNHFAAVDHCGGRRDGSISLLLVVSVYREPTHRREEFALQPTSNARHAKAFRIRDKCNLPPNR
nr:hypothetical protein [Micromonospora sp. DSM 115978]